MKEYILEVKNLVKTYNKSTDAFGLKKSNKFTAVNDVSFGVKSGEIVGLIGESGCGKTTVGRIITELLKPDSGEVLYKGHNIVVNSRGQRKAHKGKIQMIFQDPANALNPQLKIDKIVREALHSIRVRDKKEQDKIIDSYIENVGLTRAYLDRYPHELSGGQKQRVCIMLALLTNPRFIIADEVVSALDLSVQAQILNLIKKLRKELEISMLFISHDLSIVHYISDRIIVMYMGEIVESGDCEEIYSNPKHPYTQLLLQSVLELNKSDIEDDITEIRKVNNDKSDSCVFADRCPHATELCHNKKPALIDKGSGHMVKCHLK